MMIGQSDWSEHDDWPPVTQHNSLLSRVLMGAVFRVCPIPLHAGTDLVGTRIEAVEEATESCYWRDSSV